MLKVTKDFSNPNKILPESLFPTSQSLDEDFLRTEMIEEIVLRVNKLGKRRSLTVTDPKIIAVKGVNDALK